MKFSTKWSSKSGLGGGAQWPGIALRRDSREKPELLSLKDFRVKFNERKEKGKWEHSGHPWPLYLGLKHCVLQSDLPHPRESPRVFHSGHPTRL